MLKAHGDKAILPCVLNTDLAACARQEREQIVPRDATSIIHIIRVSAAVVGRLKHSVFVIVNRLMVLLKLYECSGSMMGITKGLFMNTRRALFLVVCAR